MRTIDVLFLVEHVDRELDAATCIVDMLERRYGLHADVRNFYSDMLYCLDHYSPTVVVTPFFYFLDHHPMKDYVAAWPRSAIFNMAWEQILYTMNKTVKIPKDDFARTRVTHVCWTREYRDFMLSLGVEDDRLVLTGNPVMKFYDLPYRDFFASRAELARRHSLDPGRKWVLIPENYRWAFLAKSQVKAFVRQDADPQFLIDAQTYCVRSLTKLFEWLQDLGQPGDPIVIVRPRPATAREEMVDFMAAAAPRASRHVHIIKAESAREWILAADHVISSYSTTLIEAALAGKPVHVFSPEPFPEALNDEWYGYVPLLEDREQLLGALRRSSPEGSWRRLRGWARERLLPAGDPFEEVAGAIARTHGAAADAQSPSSRPDHSRLWTGQGIVERARKVLQRRPAYHDLLHNWDKRYNFTIHKHEKDIFGADDVARRLARWRAVS